MKFRNIILLFFFCVNLFLAQTFVGNGGEIPKNDYQNYDITVSNVGILNTTYGIEKVCINLNFPTDGSLRIALRSPFGSIIYLSQNNGGNDADYTGTCFTATSSDYIYEGTPPFNGEFLPEIPLGTLNNNHSGDGIWSLIIFNDSKLIGQLISWNLVFSNKPAPQPIIPNYPNCTEILTSGSSTTFCDYTKFYCSKYNNTSSEPPHTQVLNTFFYFKAGSNIAKFFVWMKNGQPEYMATGIPIPIFITFSIYKYNTGELVDEIWLPYNLKKDSTFFTFLFENLQPCESYKVSVNGSGGECSFDYAIKPVSGLNTKEIKIVPENPKICSGDSVDLEATQGCGPFVWSPNLGLNTTSGNHVIASPSQTTTYTVTSTGICPKTANVTVEVIPKPVANAGADQTKCSNVFQMNANIPALGENGHWEIISGSVTPATSTNPQEKFVLNSVTAVLKWVVENSICTTSDTVTLTNATPANFNLNFSYLSPICIKKYNQVSPILNPQFPSGGTFSSSSGLSINSSSGTINLLNSLPGTYMVTYNVNLNSVCGNATSGFLLEIKPYVSPVVTFNYPNTICSDSNSVSPILAQNFQSGGVFLSSSNNLVLNQNTGIIDVSASQIGSYTVTYQYLGSLENCIASKNYSQQIEILAKPNYQSHYLAKSCDISGNGIGSYNLNLIKQNLTNEANAIIKFYNSQDDAILEQNEIQNLINYQNKTPFAEKIFASISLPNKCIVFSTIDLSVIKNPYSEVLGNSIYYLCKGKGIVLDAGSGFSHYDWSLNHQTSSSITVSEAGQYCVTLKNAEGCIATQCVTVVENLPPKISVQVNSGEIIINVLSGISPFEFSLDGLNWQNENKFNFSGGTLTVFVREKTTSKCESQLKINIPFIPNVITPNSDGFNDSWDLSNLSYYTDDISIKIFDRFGKILFEKVINGKNLETNGKINLNNVTSGTYWYLINIPSYGVLNGWLVVKNR